MPSSWLGVGWVGVWPPHVLDDHGVHALGIFQDFIIPEAYDPIAFALQEPAPVGFLRRQRIMVAAIEFDDQAGFVTDKIRNVAPERHLTAEPMSLDLS
jgi:uncharacterized lipoprotein YbaY